MMKRVLESAARWRVWGLLLLLATSTQAGEITCYVSTREELNTWPPHPWAVSDVVAVQVDSASLTSDQLELKRQGRSVCERLADKQRSALAWEFHNFLEKNQLTPRFNSGSELHVSGSENKQKAEEGRARMLSWGDDFRAVPGNWHPQREDRSGIQSPEKRATGSADRQAVAPVLKLQKGDQTAQQAKAEAARKKAEDDAKLRDKISQQQMAQARADAELKRLEQDLKQRESCMQPEVRQQNRCGCTRFYPPPPADNSKSTRGCSQ